MILALQILILYLFYLVFYDGKLSLRYQLMKSLVAAFILTLLAFSVFMGFIGD